MHDVARPSRAEENHKRLRQLQTLERMMLQVFFRPIRVLTGSEDRDGCLVMVNEDLVGVLVRLSADHGPDLAGQWFLEAGFGRCGENARIFDTLDSVRLWVSQQISRGLLPDEMTGVRRLGADPAALGRPAE